MPPQNETLPEGTDHIINGAMKTRPETAGGGDPTSGFIAPGNATDDTGGTSMTETTDEGIRGQFRQGVASLKDQAGGKFREVATDGKARTSNALDELSRVVEEAAESIEERLGPQFSPYARKTAKAVSGFATTLRDKDVDELYDDVAGFVKKSPAVAIGIAAALGFVAIRLIKAGMPDTGDSDSTKA